MRARRSVLLKGEEMLDGSCNMISQCVFEKGNSSKSDSSFIVCLYGLVLCAYAAVPIQNLCVTPPPFWTSDAVGNATHDTQLVMTHSFLPRSSSLLGQHSYGIFIFNMYHMFEIL